MTATVNVVSAEHRNVLRVPNAALRYRPAGRGGDAGVRRQVETDREGRGRVFVLREGRPSRVPVEVGLADEMFTEVRGEGLTAGAQVITEETEAASTERRAQSRSPGLMGGGGGGRRGMR
jgi:HlyD family secretion protein